METPGFGGVYGIGAAAWIEFGVPQGFAGIDIADACYARLIEEKIFQGAFRGGEQFRESGWSEIRRDGVDAQTG